MRLDAILEATLKTKKGAVERQRASGASLMVVMRCEDFLGLTTENAQDIEFMKRENEQGYEGKPYVYDPEHYTLPFLDVQWSEGKVLKHEGRHRLIYAMEHGVDRTPVAIYFVGISYSVEYHDDRGQHYDDFADKASADARLAQLKNEQENIHRVRVHKLRDQLTHHRKGVPFTAVDMPPKLIGQFNASYIVPASRLRIGQIRKA